MQSFECWARPAAGGQEITETIEADDIGAAVAEFDRRHGFGPECIDDSEIHQCLECQAWFRVDDEGTQEPESGEWFCDSCCAKAAESKANPLVFGTDESGDFLIFEGPDNF